MSFILTDEHIIKRPSIALPYKASEFLREVVADIRAVARMRNVVFDMHTWVTARWDGSCAVCAAGAWVFRKCDRKAMDLHTIQNLIEEMMDEEIPVSNIMHAIDELRTGDVQGFMLNMEDYYCDAADAFEGDGSEETELSKELYACFPDRHNIGNDHKKVAKSFLQCAEVFEKHGF